jgi:hypothetical protein
MEKKGSAADGSGQGVSGSCRPPPAPQAPVRLSFCLLLLNGWVFVLYLAVAGEGWPDESLFFLTRALLPLGLLLSLAALTGIIFSIVETLVFRRVFFLRFAVCHAVFGAAGFALSVLGGIFQILAEGVPP